MCSTLCTTHQSQPHIGPDIGLFPLGLNAPRLLFQRRNMDELTNTRLEFNKYKTRLVTEISSLWSACLSSTLDCLGQPNPVRSDQSYGAQRPFELLDFHDFPHVLTHSLLVLNWISLNLKQPMILKQPLCFWRGEISKCRIWSVNILSTHTENPLWKGCPTMTSNWGRWFAHNVSDIWLLSACFDTLSSGFELVLISTTSPIIKLETAYPLLEGELLKCRIWSVLHLLCPCEYFEHSHWKTT